MTKENDMTDEPASDTRNMLEVFIEHLKGADRVVVETKNEIGEMDATYLHAPTILEAWKNQFTRIKTNNT